MARDKVVNPCAHHQRMKSWYEKLKTYVKNNCRLLCECQCWASDEHHYKRLTLILDGMRCSQEVFCMLPGSQELTFVYENVVWIFLYQWRPCTYHRLLWTPQGDCNFQFFQVLCNYYVLLTLLLECGGAPEIVSSPLQRVPVLKVCLVIIKALHLCLIGW